MKKDKSFYKILLIGFLCGIANGLFGSGGGTILVPCLVFILGVEDHKAHATAIAIILPLCLVSAYIYYRSQVVDIPLTLKVSVGAVIGAFCGSMLLERIPTGYLRKFFGAVMLAAAFRMVL